MNHGNLRTYLIHPNFPPCSIQLSEWEKFLGAVRPEPTPWWGAPLLEKNRASTFQIQQLWKPSLRQQNVFLPFSSSFSSSCAPPLRPASVVPKTFTLTLNVNHESLSHDPLRNSLLSLILSLSLSLYLPRSCIFKSSRAPSLHTHDVCSFSLSLSLSLSLSFCLSNCRAAASSSPPEHSPGKTTVRCCRV
jgi:hypothetical protein